MRKKKLEILSLDQLIQESLDALSEVMAEVDFFKSHSPVVQKRIRRIRAVLRRSKKCHDTIKEQITEVYGPILLANKRRKENASNKTSSS